MRTYSCRKLAGKSDEGFSWDIPLTKSMLLCELLTNNLHAGQQEANQNAGIEEIIDAGDSDKEDDSAQDCFVLPIWPSYSSTNTPALTTDDKREGPREEEQVFKDDLERLKKQEKEAYEEAEALRKKFETLVIKEGVAKPSSTNIFSTVSTPAKASSTNPLNTASIPVSTASPYEGLSLADPTHSEEDDSEIPPLEDIYQNSTDGIFTTSSFDDEGAVADFTNLETVVNVSPIPTSRIHSTHPRALILGALSRSVFDDTKVWVCRFALGKKAIVQEVGLSRNRSRSCTRFHVTPKTSHLKQKGKHWWSTSTTEANMLLASKALLAKYYGFIITMLDNGVQLHEPKIYIEKESTICIVKKPVNIPRQRINSIKAPFHNQMLMKKTHSAGKSVSISEASIRSDLRFDDADGIDTLPNQATSIAANEDEGASSKRPSEAQHTPSPAPTSEVPYEPHTDSSPTQTSEKHLVETLGGFRSGQGNSRLEGSITKLKKQAKPSVSKQGRKFAKGKSSVQRDPLFDGMPEDTVDHTWKTEMLQDKETRKLVDEDNED
ncbi:hypothetical protein Tco_0461838 [Tanacetum coccineum]